MKWRIFLIVLLVLLVACASEGSDDTEVMVATYDCSVDVDGTIIDIYEVHRGGSFRMYFGRIRVSGELMMSTVR